MIAMKKQIFLCLLFLQTIFGWAQEIRSVAPPDESIFSHVNTPLFVSGETVLFKVYCTRPGRLSDISKIAYVELIGEDVKPVMRTKVELINGEGSGQFFFGSNIPSGNYTLVAYTKWMRNQQVESFFRRNITLINPGSLPPLSTDTSSAEKEVAETAILPSRNLALDKSAYTQREKVMLTIDAAGIGSLKLSVNVRLFPHNISSAVLPSSKENPKSTMAFLPDLRGELITGTVIDKSTGKPLNGVTVTLSAPSKNFNFLVSQTDADGKYAFNVPSIAGPLYMATLNHAIGDLEIRTDDPFLGSYEKLRPGKLLLDTSVIKSLGRRYLASQIQNAFQQSSEDSAAVIAKKERFFASPSMIYHLDDFTRFSSMEDVFREIVPEVVVKLKDGKFSLTMRNNITAERFYSTPLMLIDGIPILDANVLMNYDPLLVEDIAIMAHRYYYNGLVTEGIISIETYTGRAERLETTEMFRVSYDPPQRAQAFIEPDSQGGDGETRIPDYRTQLYWNPSVEVNTAETISFYTGDVAGTYVVDVAGVNTAGDMVQFQTTFIVK